MPESFQGLESEDVVHRRGQGQLGRPGSRVILILRKFGILIYTWFQVVPFGVWFSKQFLFLMCDPSFCCPENFSASMGISMGKWPKSIKWPKIWVPKVSNWGFWGLVWGGLFSGIFQAPEVLFLVPPKWLKWPKWLILGVLKMAHGCPYQKIPKNRPPKTLN